MEIVVQIMTVEDLGNLNLNDFDDFWNINILRNELSNESSYYIIAKSENDILGFAGLNFILDEAHIANIVVRKDKRRLKIGSKLLENLIEKASTTSSLITLEVNEKNLPAINLYKKYGFETLGFRKKYYNNQFDAYIMTKYFNKDMK